jgi:NAD(P)H-hydrate epimerase
MGRSQLASAVFEAFMDECVGLGIRRVVIDGDGLYHLAAYLREKRLPEGLEAVITPHFLEASRITGAPVAQIQNNRPNAVRGLASATGAVALLKGPATLVSDGERLFINTTGNPALATAGSGDVLSGIIAALLLGERTPLEAAALGAYIHGRAADLHVQTGGTEAMKSTDLLAFIRDSLAERPGE